MAKIEENHLIGKYNQVLPDKIEEKAKLSKIDLHLKTSSQYKRFITRPKPPAKKWFLKFYWELYCIFFTDHPKNPKYRIKPDDSSCYVPYPKIIVTYRKLAATLGCPKTTIEYILKYLQEYQIIGMARAITASTFNERRAGSFLWLTDKGAQFIENVGKEIKTMLTEEL